MKNQKPLKKYIPSPKILINLISNAIKFTPPMGEVKVSVIFNTQLEIRVTDSGIGMDEKTKLNLFQPYFHSHARLNQQGTGLGLTITQRLATLMHGSITVDSQRNFGSTFTVKLTLKQDNDVEQSYMLNELIRLEHPITLLLIDDDVLHHQVMAGLLADQPI